MYRLTCTIWLLGCAVVWAHPLTAAEVNYPLVAGFDRFYAAQDSPEDLVDGGLLLLNELNCVGCHRPGGIWEARLPGVQGPDLAGVGTRVRDVAVLQILIRNPRFLKRVTTMPSLFAAADRDEGELEALFHYLASLRDSKPEPMLLGEVEEGKRLYHAVGCVACHDPDASYPPPGWPADQPVPRPQIASQPIRWAEYWTPDFLTRFLMEPPRFHPGRRMPGMGLTEAEAAHIAAYLQDGCPPSADDLAGLEPDPRQAEAGGRLFQAKGCAVCHEVSGTRFRGLAGRPELASLRALDRGCLADEPRPGGLPFYFLSELQKAALRGALEWIGGQGAVNREQRERNVEEEILLRMDCYACHSFRGKGGPEMSREPYFGALDPRAADRETWLPAPLEGLQRGSRTSVRKTEHCGKIQELQSLLR